MSEATRLTRLKPFLLDRLTDETATLRSRAADSAGRSGGFALSPREYREKVVRDLRWLLNSHSLSDCEQIDDFPQVACSVLNYGLPDLTSMFAEGATAARVESMIRRAIERFEPRILRKSLKVKVVEVLGADSLGTFQIEIEAEVWAVPVAERLYLRTEIDLGIGRVEVASP
ncbi:MAG: type VI secretion system baseplate subunit TssE [Tepidisphaeraceae bacterium]|jgi:type VI secretion system protein ImpF